MKKVRIIILFMTLFLGMFFLVPVKVFANSTYDGTAEDWLNHISQFDHAGYGIARCEIYQDTLGLGLIIVEEPLHEVEGLMYEYDYYSHINKMGYFEPNLRSCLRSWVLDGEDVLAELELEYDYFDGFLYWNFEEQYWQVEYYGTTELEYYKQRVDELEDEIQDLENEISLLENQIQNLENEIQDLENEIELLENEIQDLENEIQDLENQIQDLENEIQQLEDEISLLQNENSSLNDEIQRLEDEIQQLEDEKQQLEDEISSLEDEISSLEEENSLLEDEIQRLENEKSLLEDEIQQLEDEIQQLEEALELEYDRGYNDGYEIGYSEGLLVENNDINIIKWFVPLVVIIIVVGIIEPIIILKRRG